MRLIRGVCVLAALTAATPSPVRAIVGVGVHWGFDWSLSLDDQPRDQLSVEGLKLDITAVGGTPPPGFPSEIPADLLPIYISRTNWERSPINFGGKLLIDAMRLFELEVSTNIGVWEYDGRIVYPRSLAFADPPPTNPSSPAQYYRVQYDSLPITCERMGLGYWGADRTPYVKMHFDLTVKRAFLTIPKRLKTFSVYGGLGASLHFATPVLSAELIEEALGTKLNQVFGDVTALGSGFLGNSEIMEAVLKEIIAGLTEPTSGMHIVVGAQVKVPVIPLAFYADGKLSVPFGNMDPYVDLKGFGFLANAGIMLKF